MKPQTHLFIANPHAGGGRVRQRLPRLKAWIKEHFPQSLFTITQTLKELTQAIQCHIAQDVKTIIAIWGDGTLNHIVNVLHQLARKDLTVGFLPMGTGQDWARTLKTPLNPRKALAWLRKAKPAPCDLVKIQLDDLPQQLGLNIISIGLSGQVAQRVNRMSRPTRWAYLWEALKTLWRYQPEPLKISVDGKPFYHGNAWMAVMANGKVFGKGMKIAPQASIADGLLDLILVPPLSRWQIYQALPQLFLGNLHHHPALKMTRGKTFQIQALTGLPLAVDIDGESWIAQNITVQVLPSAISVLQGSHGKMA